MPHATDSEPVHRFDDFVKQTIHELDADLREVSLSIHAKPELGWEEHHAHDVLTAYMERQPGFVVERSAYGLSTAWSAIFTSSAAANVDKVPTVGFNSEMDALKGLGHACGHNLIAVAGCASAIAAARTLEHFGLPGRVVLLGTPAEEGGGGKVVMLERGAYDGLDACLMIHPGGSGEGQHGGGSITTRCILGLVATFTGVSAHAGGAPETAINALDAAVVAYSAISVLRQQLPPGVVVHGIIAGSENWSSNIIPANARLEYGIRSTSASTVASVLPRILACFEGAATASGCKLSIDRTHIYLDMRPSAPLARAFGAFSARAWADKGGYDVRDESASGASTDFGNVSYHCPALHPMFLLPDAPAQDHPHSDTYVDAAALPSSHEAALRAAAGIASAGLEVLVSRELRDEIAREWKKDMQAAAGVEAVKRIEEALPAKPHGVGKSTAAGCGCEHGGA